jgi:molybdenum cofactor cytidylyltransferase
MNMTILIPAAGSSSRMRGGDKLLELVAGEPMLRRQARLALGVCTNVLVTLRVEDTARQAALAGLDVVILEVPDAGLGMSASLRAGAAEAMGALMILPADMPEIDRHDLSNLINEADQTPLDIIRGASFAGVPGHPVIFPVDIVPEFAQLKADEGARRLLQRHSARLRLIALPGDHALTDLDTPEEWAAWRLGQT